MEYIYAAMLIHKAGGKVDESKIQKVLEAAGIKPDNTRIKALVASLDGINIDEAIKKATTVQAAAPAATTAAKEEKKEEKKEDEKKQEAQAAAGLGALFG